MILGKVYTTLLIFFVSFNSLCHQSSFHDLMDSKVFWREKEQQLVVQSVSLGKSRVKCYGTETVHFWLHFVKAKMCLNDCWLFQFFKVHYFLAIYYNCWKNLHSIPPFNWCTSIQLFNLDNFHKEHPVL